VRRIQSPISEMVGGQRLADAQFARGLRGRGRALPADQLVQLDPQRVGQGPDRHRIIQVPPDAAGLQRHAGYDFSPASLDALQPMLRRGLPAGDADVDRPANATLVAGAAWYFGEVITRHKPAAWVNPDPGQEPYVYNAARIHSWPCA
jgi:hypothetical protein